MLHYFLVLPRYGINSKAILLSILSYYLYSLFPLHESDITVADKNGNIVINEQQTSIYESKALYIYTPEDYPYTIEITSPAVDITGEITLEEED